MLTNFLMVTDPVGTLKTRNERVLYKSDLGPTAPNHYLAHRLDTHIRSFTEICEDMDRTVELCDITDWHKRLEVRNSESDLVAVRDVQIIYTDEEEVQ